jgi:hypothetical protein
VTQNDVLDEGGSIKSRYAAHIRYTTIAYLNSLEIVMIAWLHGIADRDIILQEFEFLVIPGEGSAGLETFRVAVGIATYPGINAFVHSLRNRERILPGQPATGSI